jgi:hypothetical protein
VILIQKNLEVLYFKIHHLLKNENLEWCHKFPSDKEAVHMFVGEQNRLNKTAAPNISENSQALDLFLLNLQTILAVTEQETNCYMQQDAKARNKS